MPIRTKVDPVLATRNLCLAMVLLAATVHPGDHCGNLLVERLLATVQEMIIA